MNKRRRGKYRKHWYELVALYGSLCFYCREEVAVVLDHIVPWSYDMDDSIENLVPACVVCNSLASDKHFEYVEEKRQYILGRRKNKKLRRAFCVNCFLPFEYRSHSPSLFLCAHCYDAEYETGLSGTGQWLEWLLVLETAGYLLAAHKRLRNITDQFRRGDKKGRVAYLVDAYDLEAASILQHTGVE